MGFNCVFIALACYFTAALVVFIFRSTFIYNLLSCAAVTLLDCLLYWLFFVLIGGGSGSALAFFAFYLPSAVYTVAVSPLLYLALKPLKNKLNKVEKIIAD